MIPKIPPAYWLFPIVLGFPSLWVVLCKGLFETSAKLTYLGWRFNWIRMMFRQICEFGSLSVMHYWLHQLFQKSKKIPLLLLNAIFFGIYFEIFGFGVYDFEYTRINMQMVLPSIFTTYAGRYGGDTSVWTKPLASVPNSEAKVDTTSNIIYESLRDQPYFWYTTILIIIGWIILLLAMAIIYREIILSSAYFEIGNFKFPIGVSNQIDIRKLKWAPKDPYNNVPFILSHVLAGFNILFLFGTFCIKTDFQIAKFSILPYMESVLLAFSHFEKDLAKDTKKELTNIVRNTYLPPNRRWLDNRKDPVYPAVHGDMNAFCAYNNDHPDCKDYTPSFDQKPLVKELPNVVLILYESLTPSYDIITKEFIVEHAHLKPDDPKTIITDTPYYNTEILEAMNKYQKYALTFSGLSSNGIPTASAYHSSSTGFIPSQTFNNIIDGSYAHADDLPSVMNYYGYRGFFICASQFSFDGMSNWVFRKSARDEAYNKLKCKEGFGYLINDTVHQKLIGKKWPKMNENCDPKEVDKLEKELKKQYKDFPRWYDNAFDYIPSPDNVEYLGVDPKTLRLDASWPGDRLTAAEFRTHWNQIRNYQSRTGIRQPIFGHYLTIDSHLPYSGYDKDEYYDPINETRAAINFETYRDEKFRRVNKYSSKHAVGETLDFLRENEPNTIFIVTGDHGTRDIPVREPNMHIYDDVIFASDCVHTPSGSDSFYLVSGMIGYLGDDPVIKEALGLDKFAGKTIKIPADHSDIMFTIEDILARLNGTTVPPTHRRSRNLIDLSKNITEKMETEGVQKAFEEVDKSGWKSASVTTLNLEYREGTTVIRSPPANENGAHLYQKASFPMCYIPKGTKPMELGTKKDPNIFKRMFKYISVTTHLQYHNRMFHYSFRDEQCIKKGKCEFPQPTPTKNHDVFFYICLAGVPIIFLFIFGLIPELIIFISIKLTIIKDDGVQLNPSDSSDIIVDTINNNFDSSNDMPDDPGEFENNNVEKEEFKVN
ncbi:hypothetical protein TRFO_15575 [Tritrichomonas foetus]|uniref:Sulfatase N-terminal domain-containing protein n=1 Tax=Tritrichomonas foetus TaxID=1144522 RepID=A0A1J4KWE3_9EUKA|nr:hypothetical protein TRFO_15575 [Tritrichomonas foetus]|eukprot:OHT14068.1 hypothetical protein TRFO_15575 [Tritrichomonas foetus]